ncbi:MAG: DUF5069 domain-containing protein [Opitutaceae bacterium]|nr:DUF5069 domain-containing protein [Opitutaceae bacterium]|tara:strand:- start:1279 stop:1713 length:435 start_codon:yes stop_codon:yes gene_type:complete
MRDPNDIADLPSPYYPHPEFGLLHLPRFIAKIRLHLKGQLPKGYHRNFTRGFDGFLCLYLDIYPQAVIEIVKTSQSDEEITQRLKEIIAEDPQSHIWNRKLVQMGMSEEGEIALQKSREHLGVSDRKDIKSFADIIEYDEGRLD